MHWPVPAEALRPLIPEPLVVDTHDGLAWVGITPFTMWGVRAAFAPLPYLSESHELNVRTYVHLDGVPGVWFFSLDAGNAAAVLGARVAFHLPYFRARMSLERRDRTLYFSSRRVSRQAARAEFEAVWTVGDRLGEARPGSLDFPDRALLPLRRLRGQDLPRSDHPPALAAAQCAPVVVPLDDARVARAALADGRAVAAPAGRTSEGCRLAQDQGPVADLLRR